MTRLVKLAKLPAAETRHRLTLVKLKKMMIADAGKGIDLRDAYWWLDRDTDFALVEALVVYEQFGNPEPLKEWMCRGQRPVNAATRLHLDDFFERQLSKNKRGRPHAPSYAPSDATLALLSAIEEIDYLLADGMARDVNDAIDGVVSDISDEGKRNERSLTVRDAYIGKHGGMNRARSRFAPR